ncbi:FMN-binding protein [Roseisalinus antarcticus]|uniref:Na(+)-translocating NADH-quinone reductase subunit C n=1 Tax=Roseisalinus antarcticus TaxID=254357 RepID=A0A1Y5RVI9_9RHOB|nr:FMN-binding protein [Roseisalinus antarcticus]SLN26159.1 Na(+)-translocating NADH-quinone reductase subunit C [Roseisalinus antarcticus]
MADHDRTGGWRGFLAQPNDTRFKTLFMALAVSVGCAVLVSGATVLLRPIQAANRAAEEQARIEALVLGIPGMEDLLSEAGGTLGTVVVDLDAGRAATGVTPDTLQTALADAGNWSAIPPAEDLAGLGQRPDYAQIYLLRDGEEVSLVLLPISGAGYNGRIDAVLALGGDMATIAGLAVTAHSETPGLGGRIEEQGWLSDFPGTRTHDADGNLRFAVARGAASSVYEVDGITGATRTSSAVTRIVRFWLGPLGYGPVIDAIQRGDF